MKADEYYKVKEREIYMLFGHTYVTVVDNESYTVRAGDISRFLTNGKAQCLPINKHEFKTAISKTLICLGVAHLYPNNDQDRKQAKPPQEGAVD